MVCGSAQRRDPDAPSCRSLARSSAEQVARGVAQKGFAAAAVVGRQGQTADDGGGDVAVIIADTFGRPWREGLTNIAIGVAGFAPLKSYLGDRDPAGRPLQATILAIADELAGAAEPVMGKLDRIPAALVRGLPLAASEEGSKALLRDPARDLFR